MWVLTVILGALCGLSLYGKLRLVFSDGGIFIAAGCAVCIKQGTKGIKNR